MNAKTFLTTAALSLAFVITGCNKSGKLNTSSNFTPPSGPIELKLKWTPGETIVQDFDMTQAMVMDLPGRPEPMKQGMDMGQKLSLTVLNADPNGGHEVEMQFVSARVSMPMGQKKINYDSDKNKDPGRANPAAEIFSKIIGAKVQYYLDASNNIERVEGIDDLTGRLSSGGPAAAQLKGMFNESYFKQMMSFTRFMPPGPVQPGDTWPVKMKFPVPMLGTMDTDYNFTFVRWETRGKRNCARIEFTGAIQTEPGAAGPNGMSISIQDGSTTGVFWFDPEFGTVIDSKMDQDMTMLITIPSGRKRVGAGSMQTITNQMTQIITFKVDSLN